MKDLFNKALVPYEIMFFILMTVGGLVILPFTENYFVLITSLFIGYILVLIILLSIYTNYIKPIHKATKTVREIEKGNYRARFHFSLNHSVSQLSYTINSLARNLSEYSIQEQMQSEQLTTIIENTENGLVLVDQKGYIHLVNRKFIQMFGRTPKDYCGYLYYDVLVQEVFHKIVQEAFLYEKHVRDEFSHFIGLDKFYYEVNGVPIFNKRGMLRGAVIVIHDITDMKKMEKTRKDFVANVSHELRTPITSIIGFAETLLDGGLEDKDSAREFLKIILNESDRMQLLVEDLMILSKLEEDNFQLVLNKINVEKLVEEIIPALKMKANRKGLTLTTSIEKNLTFKADQEKVKQILVNLIDNSINYTPEEGNIDLNIASLEKHVHLKVSDTGIGIEQKSLPRIFERFYRVDKARSRNTGGTGLGLAIVKHIVEVHGGKIEIESIVNEGTDVHVYLPK